VNGSAAPTTAASATTTPAPTTTVAVATGDVASETDLTTEDEALSGAFTKGWFSDRTAWPQVVLWGLVCSMIAFAAWWLSRRVGRMLVGYSIGVLPFFVALYFFYENVNRLLPPGL
jgi:sortase A